MVATAAIGAGASIYSANKAANAQKAAMNQSAQLATQQAAAEKAANERLLNNANKKQGDYATMALTNRGAMSGGVGSTMLTGPGGAPATNSILGRATLLGG
jgi:hypothetical protein